MLSILHRNVTKKQPWSFTNWRQTTCNAIAEELLQAAQVDTKYPDARGSAPDLLERDTGELASPVQGDEDPTETRQECVTARFTALKTHGADPPHAVGTVWSVRFSQHILKCSLIKRNWNAKNICNVPYYRGGGGLYLNFCKKTH
jgi:hypothetical protein